ncbi:MAG: class I SAM-dependent methyltransferase [Chlamydiota bacterium]
MRYSQKIIDQNHARLQERDELFRQYGYDFDKSIQFVLSTILPLAGAILEIGTGNGRFLSALATEVPFVTTVDVDPSEQRFARLNAAWRGVSRKIKFLVQNAERLAFRNGSFDAVVSMNALHHFCTPITAVHEMVRVLRPGGRIMLSDLDRSGYRIFDRVFASEGRTHTRFHYQFKDLADCLRMQGHRTRRYRGEHQELLIAEHCSP